MNLKRDGVKIYKDIKQLQHQLLCKTGLEFNLTIEGTKVVLDVDDDYECIMFKFTFCNNNKGIELEILYLSEKLKRQGIGTYCVNWLKNFSNKYGFTYIILGAFDSAAGFWFKMDFKDITHSNIKKYCRKCNYCEIKQYLYNNKIERYLYNHKKDISTKLKSLKKFYNRNIKRKLCLILLIYTLLILIELVYVFINLYLHS